MKYQVQIDGTAPDQWKLIEATNREAAVFNLVKPMIIAGQNPERAYVGLGESRHPNGAPICVQSFTLNVNRLKTRH